MSSRLASFKGPSTPNSSPVQQSKKQKQSRKVSSDTSAPSPSKSTGPVESPFHRKTRALLLELRAACELWDDLVLLDGFRAAKKLVDTKTELQNELSNYKDERPTTRIVSPKIAIMEQCILDIESVLKKLKRQFTKMIQIVGSLEQLLPDAQRIKGWEWVQDQPLWISWSLFQFSMTAPEILPPYMRSLKKHQDIYEKLKSYGSLSFEDARESLAVWINQAELEEMGWESYWEPICSAEIDKWEG